MVGNQSGVRAERAGVCYVARGVVENGGVDRDARVAELEAENAVLRARVV